MKQPRRQFIAQALLAAPCVALGRLSAAEPAAETLVPASAMPADRVRPVQDPALVREFVSVCHRNLARVRELVAQDPKLVLASVDTGNVGIGDWETGLNGAAHTGNRDIALFLLDHGARIDAFAAAMLGYRDLVLGLLRAEPRAAATKGPHGLTLLYHAAIGSDVEIAAVIKPALPPGARDFDQALGAAAREGRLEMTRWLLENGVTDVNTPDGFKRTPLRVALDKGHAELAALLREHGGKESL